jgi:hypothetical protein
MVGDQGSLVGHRLRIMCGSDEKIQRFIELVYGCIKILGISYAYKKLYLVKMRGLLGVWLGVG